jgi:serine/threonine protein kinase
VIDTMLSQKLFENNPGLTNDNGASRGACWDKRAYYYQKILAKKTGLSGSSGEVYLSVPPPTRYEKTMSMAGSLSMYLTIYGLSSSLIRTTDEIEVFKLFDILSSVSAASVLREASLTRKAKGLNKNEIDCFYAEIEEDEDDRELTWQPAGYAIIRMPYYGSVSLGDVLFNVAQKSGVKPPLGWVGMLARKLIAATLELHGRNIASRDLNPNNIMLTHSIHGSELTLEEVKTKYPDDFNIEIIDFDKSTWIIEREGVLESMTKASDLNIHARSGVGVHWLVSMLAHIETLRSSLKLDHFACVSQALQIVFSVRGNIGNNYEGEINSRWLDQFAIACCIVEVLNILCEQEVLVRHKEALNQVLDKLLFEKNCTAMTNDSLLELDRVVASFQSVSSNFSSRETMFQEGASKPPQLNGLPLQA